LTEFRIAHPQENKPSWNADSRWLSRIVFLSADWRRSVFRQEMIEPFSAGGSRESQFVGYALCVLCVHVG
jgi:hypothetical protein